MDRETSKRPEGSEHDRRRSRRARIRWDRLGAGIGLTAGLLLTMSTVAPAQQGAPPVIRMARVADASALGDPGASAWGDAEVVRVPVLAQAITTPSLARAEVAHLDVRAVHDGSTWAVRIEWTDKTRSDRIVVDNFGDQVAVQVPMQFKDGALPSPMMGNPGARVAILQWRAALQHDLEFGHPKLRDVYPNAMADLYPDQVLTAIDAKPYTGALGVDNPVSTAHGSPVLDQMAEGFGTMTVTPEQHANGKGAWTGNRWTTVISHPLWQGKPYDPDVRPGARTAFAFAVWEGGNNEVGSRKGWASWVNVEVAP